MPKKHEKYMKGYKEYWTNEVGDSGKLPAEIISAREFKDPTTGKVHFLIDPAAEAYLKMVDDAKKAGFRLGITNAYRDYETQRKRREQYERELQAYEAAMREYQSYSMNPWKNLGKPAPNRPAEPKYAKPPGKSVHGWGRAIDINAGSLNDPIEKNPELEKWLYENAPRYGFARISNSEPFHYEYIGYDNPYNPIYVLPDDMDDYDLAQYTLAGREAKRLQDQRFTEAMSKMKPSAITPLTAEIKTQGLGRHPLDATYRKLPIIGAMLSALDKDPLKPLPKDAAKVPPRVNPAGRTLGDILVERKEAVAGLPYTPPKSKKLPSRDEEGIDYFKNTQEYLDWVDGRRPLP